MSKSRFLAIKMLHHQQQQQPHYSYCMIVIVSIFACNAIIQCSVSCVLSYLVLSPTTHIQPNVRPPRQNPCCAITSLPTRKHSSTHRHLIISSLSSIPIAVLLLVFPSNTLLRRLPRNTHIQNALFILSHTIDWVKC